MKFIAKATMPVESGNLLCKDKEMGARMEALMGEVKPESVYFGIENGQRTIYCLVNLDSGHEIPRVAEPFWLALKADVEFIPVMTQDELKKASGYIENSVRKFSWY